MALDRDHVYVGNEDNVLAFLDTLDDNQISLLDHLIYVAKQERDFYSEEEENDEEEC